MKAVSLFLLTVGFHFISNSSFAQVKVFEGNWVKINTTYVFDFELRLNHAKDQKVEGYFKWKLIQYDEGSQSSKSHYENRLGSSALEFVKGSYNPATREYIITGYRKEDPNSIIGLDTYRLKLDHNNDIGGTTRANGSWLGRINGKSAINELL